MNDKIKEITIRIVQDEHIISPRLHLEKINAYSFETKDDGGSGNAYRDLITFDLANMYTSNIPFVVHDADLMAPIEKLTLSELIKEYDSAKKDDRQVFVSFKSY